MKTPFKFIVTIVILSIGLLVYFFWKTFNTNEKTYSGVHLAFVSMPGIENGHQLWNLIFKGNMVHVVRYSVACESREKVKIDTKDIKISSVVSGVENTGTEKLGPLESGDVYKKVIEFSYPDGAEMLNCHLTVPWEKEKLSNLICYIADNKFRYGTMKLDPACYSLIRGEE